MHGHVLIARARRALSTLAAVIAVASLAAGCPAWAPFDPGAATEDAASVDTGVPRQDASHARDAATGRSVACGADTCSGTDRCCLDASPTCTTNVCPLALACDGFEDCAGEYCCWFSGEGSLCMGGCSQQLCHTDDDCAGTGCSYCTTGDGVVFGVCQTGCPSGTTDAVAVRCGSGPCADPDACCLDFTSYSCSASACTTRFAVRCDGPEDCGGTAPICCYDSHSGTRCSADASCTYPPPGGARVCHHDADCSGTGARCESCAVTAGNDFQTCGTCPPLM
jgi:hypothetical protein